MDIKQRFAFCRAMSKIVLELAKTHLLLNPDDEGDAIMANDLQRLMSEINKIADKEYVFNMNLVNKEIEKYQGEKIIGR